LEAPFSRDGASLAVVADETPLSLIVTEWTKQFALRWVKLPRIEQLDA
jgi:hypothetical protein